MGTTFSLKKWFDFKSHRGQNKNLSAQISNSNIVGFNFQTYIYIYADFYIYCHVNYYFIV